MAHTYTATVAWSRGDEPFTDNRYSRGHELRFDGGAVVRGSSSPSVVPRFSDPAGVDPEEALVAALSACHMLFFLAFAAQAGLRIDTYEDAAEGVMTKGAGGKLFMSKVTLRPSLTFSGPKQPTAEEIAHLHHRAHEECYIANSVKGEVVVDAPPPRFV